MKKRGAVIVLFLFLSAVYARATIILAGLNYANVNTENPFSAEGTDYKLGLVGGFGFEMGTGQFNLEMDVLYFQKGFDLQSPPDGTVNFVLTEISLPVLLKIKFKPGSAPYFLVGGEGAYIFSFKSRFEGQTLDDFKENLKTFDYGLVFGGGLEFDMTGAAFILEARYHHGLAQLSKTDLDVFKTRAFVGLVGLKF